MAITAQGLEQLGFISQNIRSPNDPYDFVLQNDGSGTYISEWKSAQPQPTVPEIETAHTGWQTEHDAQAYARNRQAEYPHLNDLIVALWEGVVEERMASVTALEVLRQAVKTKYPIPE